MKMTPQTIVVLGGGVGGVVAAKRLRKRLPRVHRVVIVDRDADHLFAPSLLWLMVGLRQAKGIQRPLRQLERHGIEVVHGEIERVDPTTKEVVIAGASLKADVIVVALGAEFVDDAVPGLAEAGHNFYALGGAERFAVDLASVQKGRIVVLTAATGYKCPAAPYEAALLIDDALRKRGVREAVEVELFAAEPTPMGVAGPVMSAAVRGLLAQKGIGYFPEHHIRSADAASRRLEFANGARTSFDVLAYVPPHRAPRVIRESALAGATGWISVDRHTLETPFADVYAVGDVVSIPLALGKPLPKAGVFAHAEAEVVAENIAASILGTPSTARFNGHGQCFLEVGEGRAGLGSGNFYAEPTPDIAVREPSRWNHFGKFLFEKAWLHTRL